MIAKVLIDIAHTQVDQLYDYLIPPHLETLIAPGQRVEVRFNHALRSATVMKLQKTSQLKHLEEVVDILDEEPLLNERQRAMAAYLNLTYATPLQHYYQLMTPRALSLKRRMLVKQTVPNDAFDAFFKTRSSVSLDTFKEHPKRLKEGLKEGLITLKTQLIEHVQRPLETRLTCLREEPVRGAKQQALLTLLKAYPEGLEQHTALTLSGASSATVKRLVDLGILEKTKEPMTLTTPLVASKKIKLTQDQMLHMNHVHEALKSHKSALLHGVNNAGKTDLYIALTQTLVNEGGTVLVMVPDVLLVKPMVTRFQAALDVPIATLYSKQSDGEQRLNWHAIKEGQARVIIGTRMAIFAPFQTLSVIIMDEAHTEHYRTQETPSYDLLELTRWLKEHAHIPTLYGTATPPLTLWKDVQAKTIAYAHLTSRPLSQQPPQKVIVDMREALCLEDVTPLSSKVLEALKEALNHGEQALILKNRKGYARALTCRECGYIPRCEACGLPLFYHQNPDQLRCHQCHTHHPVHTHCAQCESIDLRPLGSGTQQVLETINAHFPHAKTLRLDQEVIQTKKAYRHMHQAMHQADIIVGTQMIAQGFDFERVSVIVVMDADELLEAPHFDAAHETLVLLRQLTGRSGRRGQEATVFVQTYQPTHEVFKAWQNDEEEAFVKTTLATREQLKLPPYYDLKQLMVAHPNEDTAYQKALHLKNYLQKALRDHVQLLGPTRHSFYRHKGQYRYQLTLKAPTLNEHRANIARAVKAFAPYVTLISLR